MPELLFKPDADAIKQRYRQLAMIWHTDRSVHPQAQEVFEHIDDLRKSADKKLAAGSWEIPGEIEFIKTGTGKTSKLKYAKKHVFELGEMYVSQGFLTYAIANDFADLFENARQAIKGLTYANDKMQKTFSHFVPTIHDVFQTADRHVMVIKKEPNLIVLSDLQEHLGGKIEPRHTAWVLSRLHNIANYLEYNGLAHNGISTDTCFVDPETHQCALLGGWWYAAKSEQPLKGLPQLTVEIVPPDSSLAPLSVFLIR